jgi:hypothetical protein
MALFKGAANSDLRRRWEIHFTDLLYCLKEAFTWKITPDEYNERALGCLENG